MKDLLSQSRRLTPSSPITKAVALAVILFTVALAVRVLSDRGCEIDISAKGIVVCRQRTADAGR